MDESHSSELLKVGRQFTHILQHVTGRGGGYQRLTVSVVVEEGADAGNSHSEVLLKEGRMVTTRAQQHITERGENARSTHPKSVTEGRAKANIEQSTVLLKEGRMLIYHTWRCY